MRRVTSSAWFGLTVLALLGGGAPARAEFIQNTFGLAAPERTITFSEHVFPPGTPITTQFADLGVRFAGLFYDSVDVPGSPHITRPWLNNFGLQFPPFFDPFSIFFDVPVTEAAFAMITNPGMTRFTALLDGVAVETALAPTDISRQDNFYGFRDIVFNEIRVSGIPVNQAAGLDNLQTAGAVPEPAALLMLGTGALGLLAWRRRRVGA